MPTIRHVVARRTDLSTFVVHLSRRYQDSHARANLEGIIQDGRIHARTAFGGAISTLHRVGATAEDYESQKCVCFTETPLEHLNSFLATISDVQRQCEYQPYGIAITKRLARNDGANPVWYTDITPAGRDWLMNHVNALVEQAMAEVCDARGRGEQSCFGDYPIARLTPFIEQMGSGQGYRKEFWWEREWRHVGPYTLPLRFIVIAPEAEHDDFEAAANARFPRAACIDADWGLEEIIGRLAGFSEVQVGPNV